MYKCDTCEKEHKDFYEYKKCKGFCFFYNYGSSLPAITKIGFQNKTGLKIENIEMKIEEYKGYICIVVDFEIKNHKKMIKKYRARCISYYSFIRIEGHYDMFGLTERMINLMEVQYKEKVGN